MSEAVLTIEDLHLSFPIFRGEVHALNHVSLEIKRGEIEILFKRYHSEPRPVYALYTEKDKLPLKVQVCINYLTEYFKRVAEVYQGYR